MTWHYCYAGASAGGNGTEATPWNSLTAAQNGLRTLYGTGTAAAGHGLVLRGTFTGVFVLENLKGTAQNPFKVVGDAGFSRAVIDGQKNYPLEQTMVTFNWYRNNSGALARGSGAQWPWYAGLIRMINCEHVGVEHVHVTNSMAMGVSGMRGGYLKDVEISYCLTNPVVPDKDPGFDWYAEDCHFHHTALLNWRGAQCVIYPIIGGTILSGENGASGSSIAKTIITRTGNRKLIRCKIHNTWGEGVNIFSAVGVEVIDCEVFDTHSVGIYVHNAEDVKIIGNRYYLTDAPEGWDYTPKTAYSKDYLVYPGFPQSRFTWTSVPPVGGGTPLSNPYLSGDDHHIAGIALGTEYPQLPPGVNVKVYNNMVYRRMITEYWAGQTTKFMGVSNAADAWTAERRTTTGLVIAKNTVLDAPGPPIKLHSGLLHPGSQVKDNVMEQLSSEANPGFQTSETTHSGNCYRYPPSAQYLTGTNKVGGIMITRGSGAITKSFFLPLAGSAAAGAGEAMADVLTDANGVVRPNPPASGALEPLPVVVESSERFKSTKWYIYVEGTDAAEDLEVAEIELAAFVGGANIAAIGTVTASAVASNPTNVTDGNTATTSTTTAAAVYTVTFPTAMRVAEVRLKYPATYTANKYGPIRVAVMAQHPRFAKARVPMGEATEIVPTAGQTVVIQTGRRLGLVREIRRRAVKAALT